MTDPTRSGQTPTYDLFLDLSRSIGTSNWLETYLSVFQRRIPVTSGQRLTAALGSHSVVLHDRRQFGAPPRVSPLAHALELAHVERRGLLVIRDAWIPNATVLDGLARLAAIDPNIGTIQPRFSVGSSGDVLALPALGPSTLLPRPYLRMLPEFFVTPEIDAACIYITPQALPACDIPSAGNIDVPFLHQLIALRRRGFRTLVANYHVAEYPYEAGRVYRVPAGIPDLRAAESQTSADWLAKSSPVKLERLLAAAKNNGRKRLLLDCRGMTAAHNGSAHAILGYLEGMARLGYGEWDITVSVGRQAAEFHQLNRRLPQFRYEFDGPQSTYLVAIHLSQPWSMNMIGELHNAAPLVAFNILDTIAWDAIYPAPPDLDAVTHFAARFADGLTYLSEHSRLRFRFRFSPHERMREAVTYLSLSREDYGLSRRDARHQPIGILVVGNSLDHKNVDQTTDKLAEAFPFTPIVAFGTTGPHASPNVRCVPSGFIDDATVLNLFERAAVIVYPSFSEGFGIPVVRGLALGKRVVVRDLPLWDEIRAKSQLDGSLDCFRTDAELVEAIGRALRSEQTLIDTSPNDGLRPSIGWEQCAQIILDFADGLVEDFTYDFWQSRDLALSTRSEPRSTAG